MKSAAIQSAVDEAGLPLLDIRGRAMLTDVVMSSLALVSLLLLLLAVHSVRRLNFWVQQANSSSHLIYTPTRKLFSRMGPKKSHCLSATCPYHALPYF